MRNSENRGELLRFADGGEEEEGREAVAGGFCCWVRDSLLVCHHILDFGALRGPTRSLGFLALLVCWTYGQDRTYLAGVGWATEVTETQSERGNG